MGRLFAHISSSVDGFINDNNGGIDWWTVDQDFNDYIDAMLGSIEAIVLGRRAHDDLAQFWPEATAESATPTQARLMHELPKYVLTHGHTIAAWNNSHLVGPDPAALRSLKQNIVGDVAVFAGAEAINTALDAGVVDQIRLVVHPALVGGGTRLFTASSPLRNLELRDIQQLGSGVLVQRYDLT